MLNKTVSLGLSGQYQKGEDFTSIFAQPALNGYRSFYHRIESLDPDINLRANTDDFLYELNLSMKESLTNYHNKMKQGIVHPFYYLNMGMPPGEEPMEEMLVPVPYDYELRWGFWPIAANPYNPGHDVVAVKAADRFNLDLVADRMQGKIGYKSLRRSEQVPADQRFRMMKGSIAPYYPMIRATAIGRDPNDDRQGPRHMHELMNLSPDVRQKAFFLIGAEDRKRQINYMTQNYEAMLDYGYGRNPKHSFVYTVAQRGLYGAKLDLLDDLLNINEDIHRTSRFRDLPLMDIAVLQGEGIDFTVSSSLYRHTQKPIYVSGIVQKISEENGYYNNPIIDLETGKPVTTDPKEWHLMQLASVAGKLAAKIDDMHKTRDLPGDLCLVSCDGGSASAKTLASEAAARATKRPKVVLHLDMALKAREWRLAIQKKVTGMGSLSGSELKSIGGLTALKANEVWTDEQQFFDHNKIEGWLKQIDEFRKSDKEYFDLIIPDAYDQESKIVGLKSFRITKGMDIYVDGKYANKENLQKYYDLRLRLKDDPTRIDCRFLNRARELSSGDALMQNRFYALSLVPSFEVYDQLTKGCIDYYLDLCQEYQDWALVPNS